MKDQLPFDESIVLLRALATPQGILASRSAVANYAAVFARDAIMAGVAGLAVGDEQIVTGLRRTLEQLRTLQGPQGQIASNFRTGPAGTYSRWRPLYSMPSSRSTTPSADSAKSS